VAIIDENVSRDTFLIIESIYINKKWYQILHTTESTYLGIPDESGNLVIESKTKTPASISNFFE
jgi:hypothetical protein